jgi:hypothetical protein
MAASGNLPREHAGGQQRVGVGTDGVVGPTMLLPAGWLFIERCRGTRPSDA